MKADKHGFYGKYGGAFVPELLHKNVHELKLAYDDCQQDEGFKKEFNDLLKAYVGRPTPLTLAKRLSMKYGFEVFLKREDLCHTGAHKINNTVGQILLARKMGKTTIIAETGAGQHGVATATVCALFGMDCLVFMGKKDASRQAPNVGRMKMLGAKVIEVKTGSRTLKDATNEAIRYWINNPNTYYLIGSVVGPHPYPEMISVFQSVISAEIKTQIGNPDCVLACVGGGSNAIGAFYHFLDEPVDLIGVEAAGLGLKSGATAATLSQGQPGVLHGSFSYLMQTTDGQVCEPYSISAGLDYPGIGPIHSHLYDLDRVRYISVTDQQALQAGFQLSDTEGIIPALESAHALAALETIADRGYEKVVVNLSGRGDKDLSTYMDFMH